MTSPSQALQDRLSAALAGQYTIERVLGVGGMGTVFLGRDTTLDRPVAIKVSSPDVTGSAELREPAPPTNGVVWHRSRGWRRTLREREPLAGPPCRPTDVERIAPRFTRAGRDRSMWSNDGPVDHRQCDVRAPARAALTQAIECMAFIGVCDVE